MSQLVPFNGNSRDNKSRELAIAKEPEELRVWKARLDQYSAARPWDNPKMLYKLAQYTWRTTNQDYIHDPTHVCDESCSLVLEPVTVYCDGPSKFAGLLDVLEDLAKNRRPRSPDGYHVCFVNHCIHLQDDHFCELEGTCYHDIHYRDEHVKSLRNVWVCKSSGTVHACGEFCTAMARIVPPEYLPVCSLTGASLGKMASDASRFDMMHAERAMIRESTPTVSVTPQLRLAGPVPLAITGIKRARKTPQENPWECPDVVRKVREYAAEVFSALVFGHARQANEVSAIVDQHNNAFGMVEKTLRRRRGGGSSGGASLSKRGPKEGTCERTHLLAVIKSLRGFHTKYPKNSYFGSIPARPEIRPVIENALCDLSGDPPPCKHPHDPGCGGCVAAKAGRLLDAAIGRMSARIGRRNAEVKGGVMMWESDVWQKRMQASVDSMANVVTRVWQNLVKYPSSEAERRFVIYQRYVLSIIYLTRTGYEIPSTVLESRAGGKDLDDDDDNRAKSGTGRSVVVIPCLPDSQWLPSESLLPKQYEFVDQGLHNKYTMTPQMTTIKRHFAAVATKNPYELDISQSDIVTNPCADMDE